MPQKGPIDINPNAEDVPATEALDHDEVIARQEAAEQAAWKYTKLHNRGAEAVIGKKRKVGPDGFVYLVDYMGGDESVVQAARVSYGKGTKAVREDRALLRYLMRQRHTTPFEMVEFKFHVRVPMDIWRQWVRHRTASINEHSTRYSEAINAAATTQPHEWREQSAENKQGSGNAISKEIAQELTRLETVELKDARGFYESMLFYGVAREQARKHLPLSTYTEAYWKIDLKNLLHFLELRLDLHAQQEIREFANAIADIVYECVPITWEAFDDYVLDSMTFSRSEQRIVRAMFHPLDNTALATVAIMEEAGMWSWADGTPLIPKPNRERAAFEAKLTKLGIRNWPWAKHYADEVKEERLAKAVLGDDYVPPVTHVR